MTTENEKTILEVNGIPILNPHMVYQIMKEHARYEMALEAILTVSDTWSKAYDIAKAALLITEVTHEDES